MINNSLFLSGRDFLDQLEELTNSGCIQIQEIIPVAADCAGFGIDPLNTCPADPSPFNHPTKIVILKVLRKNI